MCVCMRMYRYVFILQGQNIWVHTYINSYAHTDIYRRYLSYAPPTNEYGTLPFFNVGNTREAVAQARLAAPKMLQVPSAFPKDVAPQEPGDKPSRSEEGKSLDYDPSRHEEYARVRRVK